MRRYAFALPFLVLTGLCAGIIIIDWIIGHIKGGTIGLPYTLYDSSLPVVARFNGWWQELWFAETWALVLLPFILALLRDRRGLAIQVLPWALVAFVAAGGIGANIVQVIHEQAADYLHITSPDWNVVIHGGGAYYPRYYSIDPALVSVFSIWLTAQWPYAVAFVAGWVPSLTRRLLKKHKHSTSSA